MNFIEYLQLYVSEMMNFYIPDLTQKSTMKFLSNLRTKLIEMEQQRE